MKPDKITFEVWVDGVHEFSGKDAEDAIRKGENRVNSKRGRVPKQVSVFECDDSLGVKLLATWTDGERKA